VRILVLSRSNCQSAAEKSAVAWVPGSFSPNCSAAIMP
jgi:peroxiredoxin